MVQHDHSYKLLFSHPRMVRDLLDGFVGEKWLAQLDYTSLEKVNGSYVSDDLRGRANDLVWRVRWGESWIYVYLLLEFQSTVDPYMAVRILTYIGLLYEDLIKSSQLPEDGQLPPVLPIVLYNGAAHWRAPTELRALIQSGPPALDVYLPQASYLLIDERRYSTSQLAPLRNLVAALFRLENSRTHIEIKEVMTCLTEWLRSPDQASLRDAFSTWLDRVILPRIPGRPVKRVESLKEMSDMLLEAFESLRTEGKQEGEASILLRQLRKRFGELPQPVSLRIQRAECEDLERWSERLMDADVQNLDAVLENQSCER